ncbi:DUF3054 family protein [Actinomadura sp. 3N508]|uniref:DUF3054 family protein n=1 Tax=Actinomadura sp. 3N508 TaxID=3375153 RepID=UPI0037A4BBAB
MRSGVGFGADVVGVLLFVLVGRATHDESGGFVGFVGAAWPFLVGLAGGWGLSRAWRRRVEVVFPVGVVVWVTTVGVGMVLRGGRRAGDCDRVRGGGFRLPGSGAARVARGGGLVGRLQMTGRSLC